MRLSLIVALIVGIFGSGGTQSKNEAANETIVTGASLARIGVGLELTTSIVEQKYCFAGGMILTLRFSYRNTGDSKLILLRYGLPPFNYRVSASTKEAAAKDYEQVISPMIGSYSKDIEFGDKPPPDYFVVLKPGESHTPINNINVHIFIGSDDKSDSGSYLHPGHHVLQVNIRTWVFPSNLEMELQARWKQSGNLWTRPLFSLPMPFQVDGVLGRVLTDCNVPIK